MVLRLLSKFLRNGKKVSVLSKNISNPIHWILSFPHEQADIRKVLEVITMNSYSYRMSKNQKPKNKQTQKNHQSSRG